MHFTVIHILVTFALAFSLGAMLGFGVANLLKSKPKRKKEAARPIEEPTQSRDEEPAIETLDIPSLKPKKSTKENVDNNDPTLCIKQITPAMIAPNNDQGDPLQDENDATVLMQRKPPN